MNDVGGGVSAYWQARWNAPFTLMLVGDGPAETYIKSMAAQLIEGHVIFMGRVDRRNLYLMENAEVRKRLACNGPRFINRERNLHQNYKNLSQELRLIHQSRL